MSDEPHSYIINTCKEFNDSIKKDSYIDPDLTAEFPQLDKYYDKDNYHCNELIKYLFYFKNYSKGKDDIYFKNIFSNIRSNNNIESSVSYHIKNLMNGENISHITNTCKDFNNFINSIKYD